jgi:uncharacterized protein YukE
VTLSVQPAALDAYAAQVGRASDDATNIKSYLQGYKVEGGWHAGALIELVGSAHVHSMDTARDLGGRVATVMSDSKNGLTFAAGYYWCTDAQAAAAFDATLLAPCDSPPSQLEQQWAANPCGPSFSDSREPSGRLKPVDDIEYSHPLAFLDYLSPTSWALDAFRGVFGFNPLDKVTEFFLGDWEAVAKGGKALAHAGEAFDDLAYNVQGGAIAVHQTWQGVAATAAYDQFTSLASTAESLVHPLNQISQQFDSIAHGVWSTSKALENYISSLVDAAIIAGVAIAAGTALAETGIGAIVGYSAAALEVAEMLDNWGKATQAMVNLYSLVQGCVGIIEFELSKLEGAKLPDTSAFNAYRSPF